jgi:hypothetical protein
MIRHLSSSNYITYVFHMVLHVEYFTLDTKTYFISCLYINVPIYCFFSVYFCHCHWIFFLYTVSLSLLTVKKALLFDKHE